MIPQIIKVEHSLYEKDDWCITLQPHLNWPYIIHKCEPYDPDLAFTRSIVLQAPRNKLSHNEYVKQMECQVCKSRPPDCVITLWTLFNWDKM